MARNYAVKVPTCDRLRIPAHRPRIRLNGSFLPNDRIWKDTRCIRHQCLRHTAVDRCVGV